MEVIVVSLAALVASALTLFSGFGLGTLLMPVVALFFPLEVAIAMTAVVHLANNLFKVALVGRQADRSVMLRFGLPAVVCAFMGAWVLGWLANIPSLCAYGAWGRTWEISPIKLVVGLLLLLFVALEWWPRFATLAFDRKYLPWGGVVSGFFGGLSGHQGAFRSMFLLKAGLNKDAFVATGVMLGVMVDVARLLVYGRDMLGTQRAMDWPLVLTATLSAFAGAYVGAKLLKKITLRSVRVIVSVALALVALGLVLGML